MSVAERTQEVERTTKRLEAAEDQFRAYAVGGTAAAPGLDTINKLIAKTSKQVIALSDDHIVLELSDDLRAEVRGYLVKAVALLAEAEKARNEPTRMARLRETVLQLEAIRHVLREGVETEPLRTGGESDSPMLTRADAVHQLEAWFPRLPKPELAEMLGISERTLDRWRHSDEAASWHADLAVQLAGIVRHSWTAEGVARWFRRPRPELDGRTPAATLAAGDHEREQTLISAARGGRAQVAT